MYRFDFNESHCENITAADKSNNGESNTSYEIDEYESIATAEINTYRFDFNRNQIDGELEEN